MENLKPWERDWNGTQQQSLHQDDGKKPWERDWSGNHAQEKPKEDKGFLAGTVDTVRDLGVSAFKGAIGIGDAAVGLADTAASLTGLSDGENNIRNTLANRDGLIGFDPQRANKIADEWYSDDYKKARAEMQELSDRFDNSESFGGKVSALGNMLGHATFVNPSLAINTTVESLPSMFAGGAAGRALKAAGVVKSGAAAAATGEGLVMAGQQAANIQEINGDNSLSQGQALASIGTGVAGGLIGLAGARVAQKLGIDDVDAVLANGVGRQAAAKELRHVPPMSISNMMMRGAIQEGLLEELPQSTMEQIVANLATDKHWSDGVAHAGVMGVLSGGLMGAGMNAARGVQQSEYANLGETEQRWQQDISEREAVLREYHAALEKAKANFATPEEIAAIEAAFANQVDLSGGTFAQPKVTELSDYLASVSPQADSQVHTSDLADDAKNAPRESQQSANPEEQTVTESQFVENEADKVQVPQKPSEQMGLDPNHGALTAIAANAVDSGISTPAVEPVPEDAGVDFSEAQQYWDNLTADGQKAAVKALGVKGGKTGRFDDAPDAVKKGLAGMLAERKSAIDAAKSNHAVGESLPNIPLALDAVQGYGSDKAAKGLDKLLPNDVQKVFGGLDKPLRDAMLLVADYRADYALRDELGLPSMAHHYPQQVKDALSLVKQRAEADSNVGGLMESLASSVAGYRRNNGWQTPLASNLAQQNVPDTNKTADQQEIERIIQPLEADGVASNVVDYAERKMVLLDINGVKVPFYRSTGLGDKEDVEAGKWYPFFGIGKIDGKLGWVTKTGGKGTKNRPDLNMNDYYGSPTLKRYAQMLDSVYDADTLKQMNLKTHAVGKPVLDASGNPIRLPAPDAYSGFANQIELNSFVRTINDAMGEPLNQDDLTGIERRIDDVVARVEGKSAGVAPEAKAEPAVESQAETQTMQEVDAVEVTTQEDTPSQLVEVQTAKGVKRVSQADLDNQELPVLPTYTKGGKRSAVRLNRADIVQAQEQEEVQQGDVVSEAQEKQEVIKAEKVEPKLETLIEREASKQAEAGKSRIGKPAGDKLVGKNKEGIDVFEDAKGVRYYTHNKIRQTEAVRIHPSGESWVDVSRRRDEFKTVEELDKGKEQVNESGLGRISALAEDGGRTLEGVLSEDVSGVQNSGRAEVQAGRSSNDDVSGSGRAGESGVQPSRSVGDDSREVHSSAARIRSDGRVGEGRLDNQVEQDGEITEGIQDKPTPEQAVVAEDVAPNFPLEADFVITQDDAIGQGGLKTKFKQNLAAIETLKKLQAEDRAATKDEQKVLAKWVGWGGLSAAFRRADGSVAQGWAKEVEQLEAILSADELQAARESTIAAHYTAPEIVTAMWQAVERMGFKGGRVLEPSVGSGNFIGLLPKSLRKVTAIYGTELDSITGGLAQKLYPTANIKVMGFQDYAVPDGHFKLAIGNPPFGAIKITDLDRKHLSGLSLHNYFFAKSVDALEDNGVLAMVVTNRFMDASEKNDRARAYIAERTELLGAVRLPNNAFKANANTEVTTDIVFLRKLTQAERGNAVGFQWNETKLYTDKDGNQVPLNVYFHAHPEMMLGEFGAFGSMYSGQNEAALVAKDGQDTVALLNQALESLPQNFMTQPQKDEAAIVKAMVADIPDVKVGSMFVRNGQVFEREPDLLGERQARPVEYANAKAQERVIGLIGIRDLLAQVRKMQLSESSPEALLESARKKLNDAYDKFIKEHGFIHADANKRLFRYDPSYPQLASLEENYDKGVSVAVTKNTGEKPRKPSAKKADILSRRTQFPFVEVNQVSSAKDGLVESLARFGRLGLARIAALYGKSEQDVISELGDLVYQDPTYGWQTADEYLSGNVKAKLAQAKEAAQQDRAFERNVKALEAVQPADIEAVDIEIRAGSHWVPAAYVDAFLREVMGAPEKLDKSVFNAIGNEWVLPKFSPSANARTEFATDYKGVSEVVSAAFNGKQLAVYDRHDDDTRTLNQAETDAANQKVEAVKRAWADWVWQDDARRDALARLYNDIFNTNVQQRYDGSHLKLLGKVDDSVISLRPTQKNAVWRITQKNFTLLDHVVGAGKAQPLDAKILTPNGWKLMGEIKVGDYVMSQNGLPTSVEAVFPQGKKEIYRVHFSDGSWTECCDEHLWLTHNYQERSYAQRADKLGKNWGCAKGKVRSLNEIRHTLTTRLNAKNHSIPLVEPVQFQPQAIDIDAYLMGALLGDGHIGQKAISFSTKDDEIIQYFRLPDDVILRRNNNNGRCPSWHFISPIWQNNPMLNVMRELGLAGKLSHEKFIPDCYKFNDVATRLAVLQGLMDTDGWVEKQGKTTKFTSISKRLTDDVLFLVQSLGGVATLTQKCPTYTHKGEKRTGQLAYSLTIKMPAHINPFRLTRKRDAVVPKSSYAPVRYIVAVESVGEKEAQCIRVADESHLYVTDDFIVTHNTYTMVAAAMELRRMGLANKPMIVVPNHLVGQWGKEFLQLYPNADILVAGKKDFEASKRKKLVARIANGDWDAVIVAHSSFGKIAVDKEFEAEFIQQQIDEIQLAIEAARKQHGQRSLSVKDMEKRQLSLKEEYKKLTTMQTKDHDNLAWSELGIDALFVDEAHEFKNLAFTSTMQRVAGLGNQTGSQKAMDLYMKIQQLKQNPLARVVFATGTPISNSMAEMFTMQRYLDGERLRQQGVNHFDAWAKTFGEGVTDWELSASGKYQMKSRFAKFVNMPELMQSYLGFADVINRQDINDALKEQGKVLPVPKIKGGAPQNVVVPRSDYQADYIGVPFEDENGNEQYPVHSLVYRAEHLPKGEDAKKKGADNMLKIVGEARKVALDPRIIDKNAPDFESSKVNVAARKIVEIYHKWDKDKGTQLVFSDLSTPKGAVAKEKAILDDLLAKADMGDDAAAAQLAKYSPDELDAILNAGNFSVYDDLKAKLVAAGIPESEIAFIHDANTELQKDELFGKVRLRS